MENTAHKPDRRVARTKKAIKNAFAELMSEKEISEITVKDIAETADVNRKTFYNYYNSVYDIVNEIENELVLAFDNVLSNIDFKQEMKNPYGIFEKLTGVINQDFDFYSRLMKMCIRDRNCTKCQTPLGCMLYFGLVNEEEKQLFVDELMKEIHAMGDHFDVGILGAKYVCNALIEAGEAELMLKAATNPTYPSWAYMVSQGATTLWEDWEGRNSQNHHMYGDISACFYKGITGIFADESQPGFKNTIFKPQFVSMLEHASAEHLSPYGKVQSSWKRNDDKIRIELTVPTNCTGELVLPKGMKLASTGESRAVFQAGTHVFLVCQQ